MKVAGFNTIAIFDAIPPEERNTGRKLREDLIDLQWDTAKGLYVRYYKVETRSHLEAATADLLREIETNGLVPWLHLEGHGSDDENGFVSATGEYCSWVRLVELITPLNVATNMNVLLVLATCFGGSFVRAISTIDRSPVLGLIGPVRNIKVRDVEVDFPAFYKTYFQTRSIKKAIEALTANSSEELYFRTTAEEFFYQVWRLYKREQCPDVALTERARKVRKKLKGTDIPRVPGIASLKRRFRSEEKGIFGKYRDTYFMWDLHSDNRVRFPVTYEEAEKRTRR